LTIPSYGNILIETRRTGFLLTMKDRAPARDSR
jgi:hypothetical protein